MTMNAGYQDETMAELLGDFLDESEHLLSRINEALLALDQQVRQSAFSGNVGDTGTFAELLNELFRAAHSLKGLSGMLGLKDINCLTHRMENVLDAARKTQIPLNDRVLELLFRSVDCLTELIEALRNPSALPSDPAPVVEAIAELLREGGVEREISSQADAERILAEIAELEDLIHSASPAADSPHDLSAMGGFSGAAEEILGESKAPSLSEHHSAWNLLPASRSAASIDWEATGTEGNAPVEPPLAECSKSPSFACSPQPEASHQSSEDRVEDNLRDTRSPGASSLFQIAEPVTDPLAEIVDDSEALQSYLAIFVDEAKSALEELHDILLTCEQGGNPNVSEDMMIVAHRLKGAAAAVGLHRAAKVAHLMEDLLQEMTERGLSPSAECIEVLFAGVDGLRNYVEALAKGQNDSSLLRHAAFKLLAKEDLISGKARSQAKQGEESEKGAERSGMPAAITGSEIPCPTTLPAADLGTAQGSACRPTPPMELPLDWHPFWEEALKHVAPQRSQGRQVLVGTVLFAQDVPLAGLKARLLAEKLSNLGELLYCYPPDEHLEQAEDLPGFLFTCVTDQPTEIIRRQLSIGGVRTIHLESFGELTDITAAVAEEDRAETAWEAGLEVPTAKGGDSGSSSSGSSSQRFDGRQDDPTARNFSGCATRPAEMVNASQPLGTPASKEDERRGISTPKDRPKEDQKAVRPASAEKAAHPNLHRQSATLGSKATGDSSSPPTSTTATPVGETLRVDIERLDELMNLTGELVIQRARLTQLVEKLRAKVTSSSMGQALRSLRETLTRTFNHQQGVLPGKDTNIAGRSDTLWGLLDQLDEECQHWLALRSVTNELRTSVHQLDRITDRLQQTVMNTRMVPIGPLFQRFKRVVRDLMRANGKQIRLVILGEKTELDKRMIDELADPLIHLVRNAADHGIELPEERIRIGKPPEGTLMLEACHKGNAIVIRVSDDGRGLDAEKIRRKAIEKGFLSPSEAERLSPQELYQLIWRPGLSTAEKVTEISGRGMGMDIVKAKIESLNGSVELTTQPGMGTTFTIKLPLTLAILPSLLVRVDRNIFALPVDTIVEIVQLQPDQVATIQGVPTAIVRDRVIPVCRLQDIFVWNELGAIGLPAETPGLNPEEVEPQRITLVLLGDRQREIGLQVDYVVGEEDLVIKSLAENYRSIPGLTGASILGDGTVALILDVTAVIEMANRTSIRRAAAPFA